MAGTTFGEALAQFAADDPDRPSITCADRTLTRGELEKRSNQLARAFAARGVGQGDFVSICLDNSPEFFVAAFAAWKLGATPQPLSGRMTPHELGGILDLVQPAGVVGLSLAGFTTLPTEAPDEEGGPLSPAAAASWKAPTSGGSTGRPKVIVAGTGAHVENVSPFAALVHMTGDSTAVVPGPLHHNGPFMFASIALLIGTHVVLQERFDAEQTLRDIAAHRATWLYQVPTMMQRIWKLPEPVRTAYDVSSLVGVLHLAAPCPPWLKREWIDWLGGDTIIEIYAATEATAATVITGTEWLEHPGSVGRAAVGEICVLSDDLQPVPVGEVGRVWMRGGPDSTKTYTYLGAETKTVEGGWETFGDLGRMDDQGYVYLSDRDSDMILVGGSNVYPAEVEAALDEHPSILSSCVIGLPHADLGAVPHAIIQTSGDLDTDELTAYLRERLSPYKLPRTFELVETSLRDDAGKVRRSALRAERLPQT